MQMNKTTEKVGTIHCIVLISKQEARKLILVIAQIEIQEQVFWWQFKILIFIMLSHLSALTIHSLPKTKENTDF